MKQSYVYGILIISVVLSMLFLSCAPTTPEETARSEYFMPIDSPRTTVPASSAVVDDQYSPRKKYFQQKTEANTELIKLIRQQNEKLDNVVQQITLLSTQGNSIVYDTKRNKNSTLDSLLGQSDRISNELLLEMIKDQNQRLNQVIDQLKLLALNQVRPPAQYYVERVEAKPIDTAIPKNLNPGYTYEKAIRLYETNKYDKAIRAFKTLLADGIRDDLADNCYFWIGVCRFRLHQDQQSIAALNSVFKYPSSDKVEGAYFMIGQCYERLGSKQSAVNAFQKLLALFPQTSLRSITEKKLLALR